MARFNVFGKPIVFDVGGTVSGDERAPPSQEISEGNDITSFTKDQAAEYLREETEKSEQKIGENFSNDSTNLNSYSNSALTPNYSLAPGEITPEAIVKKKKTDSGVSGNKLLPGVVGGRPGVEDTDKTVVPKYTSAILTKNRFTSSNKRNGTEQFRVNPDHSIEGMGSWNGFRTSPNGKEFSDGDLANVGALLTLRATREIGALDSYGAGGPDGTLASVASILPGGAQAGLLKVSVSNLDVTAVLNSIIDNRVEPANLDVNKTFSEHKVLEISKDSYGQMNNTLESFSGLLPLGMIGLSTALVLSLKIAMKAILAVFLLISSASKSSTSKTDSIGRHFLGNYQKSAAFEDGGFPPIPLPASLFGLRETTHSFGDCVNAGIEAFFGGGVGDSFKRILETPGFYAVFCRSIVMSGNTIVTQVKGVIKGNPVQVAQNIIALVDVIKSSKIVSAMNMFAAIGDSALTLKNSEVLTAGRLSTIDSIDDSTSTGYKSRLKDSLRLAWGAGNSPSAFLLPRSLQTSLSMFSHLAKTSLNPALSGLVKNRIDAQRALGNVNSHALDHEVVRETESVLDAEYMPFYFHDLRTHEIIAFPAFLSSLSDNYSANWETSDAYGRVDPVKTYKSTNRKISLSFYIASTSLEDFDQMWYKINKLVTLVYPQWSEGTLLKNTNANFIQPFSQIQSASPIIRIRLGDLLRTNYSRFSLARLFGIGQKTDLALSPEITTDFNNFVIPGMSVPTLNEEALQNIEIRARDFYDTSKPLIKDKIYNAYPGEYSEAEDKGPGGAAAAAASAVGIGSSKPKDRKSIMMLSRVKITKIVDNETYNVVFIDEKGKTLFKDKKYVAQRSQLSVNISTILGDSKVVDMSDGDIKALDAFFNPANNSIVKSFESVSGKGLACVIDSIDFSWLDNFTWETQVYGSRAPKTCKVQMSITPIHDIAPGIDSDGFNRAPIYNVGTAVNAFGGDSYDETGVGRDAFLRKLGQLSSKLSKK